MRNQTCDLQLSHERVHTDPGEGDNAVAINYVKTAEGLMQAASATGAAAAAAAAAKADAGTAERRVGTVEQQMSRGEKEAAGWRPSSSLCLYNPLKNNPVDAAKKAAKGMSPSSPASAEMELYATNCKLLISLGVRVARPVVRVLDGVSLLVWPRVVWTPRFATTLAQLRARFPNPADVSISSHSMLLLDCPGKMVVVESLDLDGGLWIVGEGGGDGEPCRVRIGGNGGGEGVVEGRVHGEACELITAERGARCGKGVASGPGVRSEEAAVAAATAASERSLSRREVTRVELSGRGKAKAVVTVGAQDYAAGVDDEVFRIRGYRLF